MNRHVIALLALLPCLPLAAVTAGWENVNPERKEFPLTDIIWSADLTALKVEKLGGAEGTVTIADGKVRVAKTNGRGTIRITAPAFAFGKGREVRFSADVSECRTKSVDGTRGYLTASADGKAFPEKDEIAKIWFGRGGNYMKQIVNTAPGMSYRKYGHGVSAEGTLVPAICVGGEPSESVWTNWRAEDLAAAQRFWEEHRKTRRVPDRAGEMQPLEEFERALEADTDHTAEIRTVKGRSMLFLDGQATPPIVYKESHMFYPPPDQVLYGGKLLQEEGLRLGVIEVTFGGAKSLKTFWSEKGFDAKGAAERIRREMRVGDKSVFLLALGLNPYSGFGAAHPDETWRKADGTVARGTFGSVDAKYDAGGDTTPNKKTWPWVSYASPAYREAIKRNLTELVGELRRTGLLKRVVGFHLSGFHDGQFAMPFPDYSECAKAEYARYLKEDNPGKEFEYFSVQIGFRTQEVFARHLKKIMGKPVIGVRWCMSPFKGKGGAHDIWSFAHSDAIDVIVPQTAYRQRLPAMPTACNLPVATFDDCGKMLWYEFDHRNHAAYDTWARSIVAVKGLGSAEDDEMWENIDRKHHGMITAVGAGCWYYDMGGGWLHEPRLAREVGDAWRFRKELMAEGTDPWRPDVVWIIDERMMFLYNHKGQPQVKGSVADMVYGGRKQIGAAGVPFEVRLSEDFVRKPELAKRYKAALLAGFLKPDAAQRKLMAGLEAAGCRTMVQPTGLLDIREFHEFAAGAGAYVAADVGVQADVNGDFMSLHAILPGRHTIRLPFAAKVVNAKSGEEEKTEGQTFVADMTAGETCWFRIYRK